MPSRLPATEAKQRPSYQPLAGTSLSGADLGESIKALTSHNTARTRDRLAYVMVVLITVAVGVAFLLGLRSGKFSYLSAIWGITGPVAGAIIGFYFRHDRKD